MVEQFVRWLFGYLYIHIKGESATRFVNLCNGRGIDLWKITKYPDGIRCYITVKDYKKIKAIVKKCAVMPYVKKRIGFPFVVARIKKRKILLCAVFLFLALIYTLSLFVWNIGFEGNHIHTEEKLLVFLSQMEVGVGSKKADVDCSYIESSLRKMYPDIGWVSVELKGTKLYVRIEETTIPKSQNDMMETDLKVADLRATKDGIIQSVLVRSGTSKVKQGDVVKKNDLLVSGIIDIIGDNGEAVGRQTVLPDADIMMKTVEYYDDSFSLLYEVKRYTGIEKSGYDVHVLGNKIFSYNPSNSYLKYDIIGEVVNVRINKNFYIPLMYQKTTYKEYYIEEVIYTEEEAMQIAKRNLERYIGTLTKQGIQVVSCDAKADIIGGECVTSGKLVVLEPAYVYSIINETDGRGESQE